MENWKQKFDQETLGRGKSSYLNQRVVDLTETSGGYEAAVPQPSAVLPFPSAQLLLSALFLKALSP